MTTVVSDRRSDTDLARREASHVIERVKKYRRTMPPRDVTTTSSSRSARVNVTGDRRHMIAVNTAGSSRRRRRAGANVERAQTHARRRRMMTTAAASPAASGRRHEESKSHTIFCFCF